MLRFARRFAIVAACWVLAAVMLPGCGGGGGGGSDEPDYALAIDGAPTRATTLATIVLTGEGFLPPGSTCSGTCSGLLPLPVFGDLGTHTLRWRNEATGASGPIGLRWVCNCGGGAPWWTTVVPLAPGTNRIVVAMSAGRFAESATVVVTRGP